MDVKEIKKQLENLVPDCQEALLEILQNKTAGAKTRLEAVKLIYDRIGLPALKATVTKNITEHPLPEALSGERAALLESHKQTEEEIAQLREQLSHVGTSEDSDSLYVKG